MAETTFTLTLKNIVIGASAVSAFGFGIVVEAAPGDKLLIQSMMENVTRYQLSPLNDVINSALEEMDYGSNGSAKQEELLQLSCDRDSEGLRRRHDRCSHRFRL